MDKKINLEHTIRVVVSESLGSGVTTDKYTRTGNSFFKSVHIEPKKGDEHVPLNGAVRTGRNVNKERSSETMKTEEIVEDELEEDWKKTAKQAATDVADFGAMAPYAWVGGQKARSYMTGLKDTATMGLGDTVRAGADYLVKNAAEKLGYGKGTTWEKETKQQEEKKKKAQEAEPGAYKAGEYTGVAAPLATGAGGVVTAAKMVGNLAKPLVKGAISVTKNPSQLKNFSTYIGAAKDTVKGTLGLLKPQNPVTAATDIGKMSVAAVGGTHGYYAAADKDYRDALKDKLSKPGGTGEFVKDVGKTAVDVVAPGAVDAANGKDVGKNLTRAAAGIASNAWLPTFAYDFGSQLRGGQGITGEKGLAASAYDKVMKKKKVNENKKEIIKKVLDEHKQNLNEASPLKAIEAAKAGVEAAKAKAAIEAAAKAKAAAEAAAKAKAAPKPKKAPPQTEPGREGTPVKPANDPGVTPIKEPKWPAPYKPSTDPFVPLPPANVPSKVPQRTYPDAVPEPANKPPRRIEEPAPVKTPAPNVNPVETKPKAPPAEKPKTTPAREEPAYKPKPAARPEVPGAFPAAKPFPAARPEIPGALPVAKPFPAARPEPEKPGRYPAASPEAAPEKIKKLNDDPAVVPRTEAKPKTEKIKDTGTRHNRGGGRRGGIIIPPFGLPGMPSATGTPVGSGGAAPEVQDFLHRAGTRKSDRFAAMTRNEEYNLQDAEVIKRKSRKAQIIRKIIDEQKKKKRDTSTVDLHPKLKNQEPDQN